MDEGKRDTIASYLFKVFNSENIIPVEIVAGLFRMMPGFDPSFSSGVISEWKRITEDYLEQGKSPRDINEPLIITRGFREGLTENSLKMYFPEEKILINRQVFRKKISSVDFTRLTPDIERRLVEELKNESIALTEQEVIIYYNLLKINILSKLYSNRQETPAQGAKSGGDGVKIIGEGAVNYPEKIILLLSENFADSKRLLLVNEKKEIDRRLLADALGSKFRKSVHNPRVYLLMFGYGTDKYMVFIREYIKMVVSRWGGNEDEIFAFFSAYQLLNSAGEDILDNMDLAASLRNFISDRLGRIHPVYYCAILFVTVFTYILVMQVVEISGKFMNSPDQQKSKLLKLYNSEERINMLITNAFNIASGKISSYKSESREIIPNMKKFLSRYGNLIKPDDIFKTSYNL